MVEDTAFSFRASFLLLTYDWNVISSFISESSGNTNFTDKKDADKSYLT